MFNHAIIIGGTGMLAGASVHIARHSQATSLFARGERKLAAVKNDIGAERVCDIFAFDYNDIDQFLEGIESSIAKHGVPDLLVGWLHSWAAIPNILEYLSKCDSELEFVHVLSSSEARDHIKQADEYRRDLAKFNFVCYRQLILGAKLRNGLFKRWLSNEEISRGLIDFISCDYSVSVVGQLPF